jgi:hypothetical protein
MAIEEYGKKKGKVINKATGEYNIVIEEYTKQKGEK